MKPRTFPVLAASFFLAVSCGVGMSGGSASGAAFADDVRVFAVNDLGMHCVDREFSVFSLLPPYNVVHAEVLRRRAVGLPSLIHGAKIRLTYDAVADARGSINSTSRLKTDFWAWAPLLFGVALPPGQGLAGLYMPADAPVPGPQTIAYDAVKRFYSADGIPIVPTDDALAENSYPLLRIGAAYAPTGAALAHLDIVVPVSSETDCKTCHETGEIGADDAGIAWSANADPEVRAKENVLILHDDREGTALMASRPVLCASCHYSRALDLAGAGPQGSQIGKPEMSAAMHEYHGGLRDDSGARVFPVRGPVEATCYLCHPGLVTQCYRGAMKTGGVDCLDCHGNMLSVGGAFPLLAGGSMDGLNDGAPRRPWFDLPRCQSCHTGDVLNRIADSTVFLSGDGIRLARAFRRGDKAASPILASNPRFAENAGTPYRLSRGHGGLLCQSCHGSTHAEWPNADAAHNDNVAAISLQGHSGPIIECGTCHGGGSLLLTTSGPHGLHNVNDLRWVDHQHSGFYELEADKCRACHGANLEGTVLSRAAADRTYRVEGRDVLFPKGTRIGCTHCHEAPGEDD